MTAAASTPQHLPPDPAKSPSQPRSLGELFLAFNNISLQGFGGVLAIAQRDLVERKRWLSQTEFVDMLAISQVLPGPNIVNLALILGDRYFGLRGAMSALAGMLLVPLIMVLTLTALYEEFAHFAMVAGALRGMGAVAAGMVGATAVKLLGTLRLNPMGTPIAMVVAALTVVAVAILRWPLVWVVVGLGSVAVAIAWRRLH